jgi:hypothetical protein
MSPMSKPLVALALFASSLACNNKKSAEPAPAPPPPPVEPAFAKPMDTPVLAVFKGDDAHAMAGLGHELETKRPPLAVDTLKQMLATLAKDPGRTEQMQKMRALLFRTSAVLVGRPALPLLSDCVATVKDLSQLCGGALQEIEALPKK